MNDRQRLEAIVSVVCKYLPPDGIDIKQAMNEIIGLVDPLPPQRTWVNATTWRGLTDEEIERDYYGRHDFVRAVELRIKEKNNGS